MLFGGGKTPLDDSICKVFTEQEGSVYVSKNSVARVVELQTLKKGEGGEYQIIIFGFGHDKKGDWKRQIFNREITRDARERFPDHDFGDDIFLKEMDTLRREHKWMASAVIYKTFNEHYPQNKQDAFAELEELKRNGFPGEVNTSGILKVNKYPE